MTKTTPRLSPAAADLFRGLPGSPAVDLAARRLSRAAAAFAAAGDFAGLEAALRAILEAPGPAFEAQIAQLRRARSAQGALLAAIRAIAEGRIAGAGSRADLEARVARIEAAAAAHFAP